MRAQYPFFRDGDEQAQAVIGEEAVNADLDGEYQKPYAVLTQKRLYCKNEQGNFITDADALKSAGKGLLPGQNWFLWAVAACVSSALLLLCLWYWGMDGWRTENISFNAQIYIDSYHAAEAQAKECKQQLDIYDQLQKEIKEHQEELEQLGHIQIRGKYNAQQAALYEAKDMVEYWQSEEDQTSYRIYDYEDQISSAETEVEDHEAINRRIDSEIEWYQEQIDKDYDSIREVRESAPGVQWKLGGRNISHSDLISELYKRIGEYREEISGYNQRRVDPEKMQEQIEQYKVDLAAAQQYLDKCRQEMTDAETKANEEQAALDELQPKMDQITEIDLAIEQANIRLAQIDQSALQDNIQRFEDSKPAYKNAQSVQRKVKLFMPCLLAFAACVVAVIILAVLKKTKIAVMMALVSACVGLVCASLSDINLRDFGWGYYMPPPLSIALRILPILAIILGVLALWWNRKKTVFQIAHSTGAFAFTPSLYPAEELKQFAEQVKLLQAGEADGE